MTTFPRALGVALVAVALVTPALTTVASASAADDPTAAVSKAVQQARTANGTYRIVTMAQVNGKPTPRVQTARTASEATRIVEASEDKGSTLAVGPDLKASPASDDTYQPQQWSHSVGMSEQVWPSVKRDVVVAVIDSGITPAHEDLAAQIVPGFNAVTDTATVPVDLTGHGTAVSGVVAATVNNGKGIAGVGPLKVMPIKVMSDDGKTAYASDIIQGIVWATDHGAEVINISLVMANPAVKDLFQPAVDYARSKGVTIVASAGNLGESTNGAYTNIVQYPAGNPGVIGVGAVDSDLKVSSFSTRNSVVDVTGPGNLIATTSMNGGYTYWYGTSFSSPFVAGSIALGLATRTTRPTVSAIDAAVIKSAIDLGPVGKDTSYGAGFLSPVKFAKLISGAAISPIPLPTPVWGTPVAQAPPATATTSAYSVSSTDASTDASTGAHPTTSTYTASANGLVDTEVRKWTGTTWKTATTRSWVTPAYNFAGVAGQTECARIRSVSMDASTFAWSPFKCDTTPGTKTVTVKAKSTATLHTVVAGTKTVTWRAPAGMTYTLYSKTVIPSAVLVSGSTYDYTLKVAATAKGSLVAKNPKSTAFTVSSVSVTPVLP